MQAVAARRCPPPSGRGALARREIDRRVPRLRPQLGATDAHIGESVLGEIVGPVDVAQVDEDRLLERVPDALEVEGPEGVPFGDDDEGVGALSAGIGILGVLDAVEQVPCLLHAFGIVGSDARAAIDEAGDDRRGKGPRACRRCSA